jgi:acetyltransferase EpsM
MKKIIFLGASGNASVIHSTIEDINKIKLKIKPIGFLDDKKKSFFNLACYGKIEKKSIDKLIKDKNIYFVWTLISSKLRKKSIQKLKKLKIPNSRFITIIHPNSNISNFTNIGKGVTIHAFVNIGPNTFIGDHVHIFSQSSIGHDTKIKSYSYLSGKSSIGANVNVDEGCFFGLNSSIRENLKIKSWSTIGMGSVVINNVQSNSTVVGNPAKKLKK